jgi:hypothetical protein
MNGEDTARQVELLREELRAFVAGGGANAIGVESRTVSKAEITRALLAAITKTGGEHSTVKIGRNAQGRPTFEVSVRTGESDAIATAADASAEALRLWRELDELLPFLAGGSDA